MVVPVILAVLMHVALLGSLVVVFDFSGRRQPTVPLAIKATIISDTTVIVPPPREIPPEPVPEPEPEIVEPEQPDPAELERARLEAEKRRQDDLAEQQRVRREAEAEAKRVAEAEALRRVEEEARLERERADAERKRLEDIERQRQQNERERLAAEDAQRQAALEAEMAVEEARNSDDMAFYMAAIQQKVQRNWARPGTARDDLNCLVNVRQLPSGEVLRVQVVSCNGSDVVVRSIENAVQKASPLPLPANPVLFLRDFQFRFTVPD